MKNKKIGGFTQTELLTTLAIVGVLVSLAAPSMAGMVKRSRMAAAHNEFVSSLYFVRSEAAKRNRVMKMCRSPGSGPPSCSAAADGGWHKGWNIWADDDNDNQIDAGETVVASRGTLQGDARLTGNFSVAQRIAFHPSGATSGLTNGTFTLCVPGVPLKRQIIVSRPGRIRITELASDGNC